MPRKRPSFADRSNLTAEALSTVGEEQASQSRAFAFFDLPLPHPDDPGPPPPAPEGTPVRVMLSMRGPGGLIGCGAHTVHPGEEHLGLTYQQWVDVVKQDGQLDLE